MHIDQHQSEGGVTGDIGIHLFQQRQPVGEPGEGIDPSGPEMAPGFSHQQAAEQNDGHHQPRHHEQQGIAQLAKTRVVARIDVDVVLHDGSKRVREGFLQGRQCHHDLLVIRRPRLEPDQIRLQLADTAFGQFHQPQRLWIVREAFSQLAAQEDGGTTPENVIAEQQGFLVYAAIVVNLDGIEKAAQFEL